MRTALGLLVLAACTVGGCAWDGYALLQPKPAPQTAPAAPPPPRPIVTADQVDEHNAHEMAGALLEELQADAPADTSAAQPKADTKAENGKAR